MAPMANLTVLFAGMPSTGTQSTMWAMEILGFHTGHGIHAFMNKTLRDLWADHYHLNTSAEPVLQSIADHGFTALTDNPFALNWRMLVKAYPGLKVVLNERDSAEQWYESFSTKPHAGRTDWIHVLWQFAGSWWLGVDYRAYIRFMTRNQHSFGCDFQVEQTPALARSCLEGYRRHYRLVREGVPRERLLEYNVKQGWGPLCDFLQLPVPDRPFPKQDLTKRSILTWLRADMDRRAAALIVAPFCLLLGCFWACCRRCRRQRGAAREKEA